MRIATFLIGYAIVTMWSRGADAVPAAPTGPRVTWYSGGHATIIAQEETAQVLARLSETAMTEAKDAPLLVVTENRIQQIRSRQQAVEITYDPAAVRPVLGRDIRVLAVVIPLTGDIRKGTILFETGDADRPSWSAVYNISGVETLEATIRQHGPLRR